MMTTMIMNVSVMLKSCSTEQAADFMVETLLKIVLVLVLVCSVQSAV